MTSLSKNSFLFGRLLLDKYLTKFIDLKSRQFYNRIIPLYSVARSYRLTVRISHVYDAKYQIMSYSNECQKQIVFKIE
jgi:hypothetical protein